MTNLKNERKMGFDSDLYNPYSNGQIGKKSMSTDGQMINDGAMGISQALINFRKIEF